MSNALARAIDLNFGQAVEYLKQGELVRRYGWNGKGMYLFLVSGYTIKEAIHCVYGDGGKAVRDVNDAIYMNTADNKFVPWLASHTDILSEDWQLVVKKQ